MGSWLGVSGEVRRELKLQTLETCLELEGPLPRRFAPMADRLRAADKLVPLCVGFNMGFQGSS